MTARAERRYKSHPWNASALDSRAEIVKHWNRVAALRCIITGRPNPTLHHIHGGSVKHLVHKAGGAKTSDWLMLPLDAELHTGNLGIDTGMGVETWEGMFGAQLTLLDSVCRRLGYNVWQKAGIDRCVTP